MSGWPETLKYYMWSFQVHFGISLQTKAESICFEIGNDLLPTVFMVGILKEDNLQRQKICFEPEKYDYYGTELFSNINELAEKQFLDSNDSKMFYSGQGQQELMQGKHLANHRRKILKKLLDTRSEENYHYVGNSQLVHGYDVYIIIRFKRNIHDKYTNLLKKTKDELHGLGLNRSLLQTTLNIFLSDSEKLLYIPDVGRELKDIARSHKEYLRAGAENFMASIASRGNKFIGVNSLFNYCEILSTATYENEIVKGSLLIAPQNHKAVENFIILSEPFKFSDYRKTIKLLRLSENDICVITDCEFVYGLGKINKSIYKEKSESIMIINFTEFHKWDVYHLNHNVLKMVHGHPQVIISTLNLEKFYSDALRIFKNIEWNVCESIINLTKVAISQKKGTQLIICKNAKSESERLKNRCFKVQPKFLTPSDLILLMRIDGGIMIDQFLNLHAYGVLLDGKVSKKGDNSRGSRFNSAITYFEAYESTNPTMIIVISDDGMLNIIPNLKPQIDHLKIKEAIQIMKDLENPHNYNHEKFIETVEWLNFHRFYLTKLECEKLNLSNKKISEHILPSRKMFFSYGDYIFNEDMNDSYYLTGTFSAE